VASTEHDITERKRAEKELKSLYARVVSAQETERMRVARELHDGVGQILSGIKFRLESMPGKIEDIPRKPKRRSIKLRPSSIELFRKSAAYPGI